MENKRKVVSIENDTELLLTFDDGVVYDILEGVTPSNLEAHKREYTSDWAFILDVTDEDNVFVVDFFAGITMYSLEEVIKCCEDLRN